MQEWVKSLWNTPEGLAKVFYWTHWAIAESYFDGMDGSTKPEASTVQGFCLSETVSGFGEDALVVVFVGGDDVVGAVVFLGVDAGDLAHFAAAVGAGQNLDGVARGSFHVAG